MLTRCVKAYSTSCSQTVSLSPAISSQFLDCALQPKIAKINKSQIFPTPSHLAPSFGVTPFEFMEKLYGP